MFSKNLTFEGFNMQLKQPFFALSSLSLAVLLGACGGGSSSSSVPIPNIATTSTVSGSVPGTLIEAFCSNGTYFRTQSTDDGTNEHPFSIDIPSGVDCRLVMTTNEDDAVNRVITAVQMSASGVISGLFNVNSDFDLGYIPLELDPSNIIDANGDHVVDSPLILSLTLPDGVVIRDVAYDPLDVDGDDIPDTYEDDDGDGEFNREDDDDDNDGIDDVDEEDYNDTDSDGIDDIYDQDDDNDGLSDDMDSDDDNDGISDDDDDDHDDDNETSFNTVYFPVASYSLTDGRLLAAQCAQCHGTNGQSNNGWDSLAGESAAELIEEMREIKAGDEDPIMQAQAHGYSDAEIQALATWFATQPDADEDDD